MLSTLKALQGLGSTRFTPGLQLQRQLNYTQFLVPDVVSNVQNKGTDKTEDGFKCQIRPLPYIKGDKKDIAKYRPISLLNLDYEIYTANS